MSIRNLDYLLTPASVAVFGASSALAATITLTNSGSPGKDFNVGGSIAVPSTADGTYSGNVAVTVEYQ